MNDKREGASPKIGAGTFQAMGRQGLHELRNALYPGSNVAAPPEAGIYGTALPSEVVAQRHEDLQPGPSPPSSVIADRLKAAARPAQLSTPDLDRDGPTHEPE